MSKHDGISQESALLQRVGVSINSDGTLLIERRVPGVSLDSSPGNMTLPDIHAAIRQQEHVLHDSYGIDGESTGELGLLEHTAGELSVALNSVIAWNDLSDASRENLGGEIHNASLSLARAINATKREARDQLLLAASLEDRTGRINPSAIAAKMVRVSNLLAERMREIGGIAPFIALRHKALVYERDRCVSVLSDVQRAARVMRGHHIFSVPEGAGLSQVRGMGRRIDGMRADVMSVRVQPFLGPAVMIDSSLGRARDALNDASFNLVEAARALGYAGRKEY